MNLPAKATSSTSLQIGHDRALADLVAVFRNRLEQDRGETVIRGGLPSVEQRRTMQARHEDVARALRPVRMNEQDRRKAGAAIASMLSAWIFAGRGDPKETVAAFSAHLADLPLFAIENACRQVASGYVAGLSPDFPPSAARLHQLAMEACAALKQEMAQIHEVLTAKAYHEPTPDERERIGAGFQQLASDLAETDDAQRRAQREEAMKSMEEANRRTFERDCAAAGIDPARGVSPALLKKLGAA
jgi:hypothetical protein